MKAYISISFKKRVLFTDQIATVIAVLNENSIASLVFVDSYHFELSLERDMMLKAMEEIDNCDLLIAETSDKAIGIGVEVGYARGKGKKVIYLRQKEVEHSTTVAGSSDFQIIYQDVDDLRTQLLEVIPQILQ